MGGLTNITIVYWGGFLFEILFDFNIILLSYVNKYCSKNKLSFTKLSFTRKMTGGSG